MSLEHLVVPESQEVLNTHTNMHAKHIYTQIHRHTQTHTPQREYVKGAQAPKAKAPNGQSWNNSNNKIK